MQDVLAKLKEIQENYDNEDIQRAITAAEKTAVVEEQVNEDSYDYTTPDGHEIKDVTDYDDYDGYSVKLETPLGAVEAEWNSAGGRGGFGGIRASNRTLESMIGKIYGEMHDFESMDKMDWPVAVGKAVDKVMAMAKDNPSFMRSESVEEDSVEEVHEEEVVEESVDNSDLERMIKLAGRSGVLGMNTNVIIAESVEVAEDEVSEEAFIENKDEDEEDEEEVDESFETVEEETVEEDTVEVPVSALQELMKLAGYEEYKIDEYANEPEEEYGSAEDQMDLGGGLNGPKKAYAAAAGGDNPMDQEPTEIEEDNKLTFEGMYKRYMDQVVNETLEEKE